MSFKFDDSKLKKLQKKAQELYGTHDVPLSELFTDDFMRQHTDFQSLQEMSDSYFVEQVKKKSEEFTNFIINKTKFSSWEEMLKAASAGWAKRKLEL